MPVALLVLVVASFAVGVVVGALWVGESGRRALRELEWYRSTYLRETGDSPLFGRYDIFSADGGATWRNVEDVGGGRLAIKGPADPALVEYIRLSSDTFALRGADLSSPTAATITRLRRGRGSPPDREGGKS